MYVQKSPALLFIHFFKIENHFLYILGLGNCFIFKGHKDAFNKMFSMFKTKSKV